MDDLIGEFLNETSESLAALERALADHTRSPMTREGWDTAYRLMHTIKGTCGFLRFGHMEAAAAASEAVLAGLRDGEVSASESQLSRLRTAMAKIRYMMDHLAEHGHEPSLAQLEEAAPPPIQPERPLFSHLSEQIHQAPVALQEASSFPRPALVATPPDISGERIGYATLAGLVMARNQLKHLLESKAEPSVNGALRLLDGVIADLKEKLLPRAVPSAIYPRLAKILLVVSGGKRVALTLSTIREVARIGEQQRIAELDRGAMISLRGSWLPRISLASRLGQASAGNEAYALVIDIEGERLALCVESIRGMEEVMLSKLPALLKPAKLYGAASVLGDGSPCLLLDPAMLMEAAHA